MEETKLDDFAKNIQEYVNTQYELVGLQLIDRTAVSGSSLLSRLVITSVIFISVLFLSLALGFYLAQVLQSIVVSFMLIGLFYLVIALVFVLFRKWLLVYPFRNTIIKGLIRTDNA